MAQIKYVDYEALSYYDGRIKAFLATADAEVLARAGVTIEVAETPTEGSAATYIVYQNYEEEGNPEEKTKIEVSRIEIPLDKVVDSGSLVVTEATETEEAKAEIVLTIANTKDDSTESGKEEVRVDISAVAGDIAEVLARVEKLEATHDTKEVEVEGETKTVFKTVEEEIIEKGANAIYVAEDAEAGVEQETVGEALARMEDDLTYKGTVAELPENPNKGDLYNVVPEEGAAEDAPKGWKFWDGENWQSLDDPTLTARVEALEATHATKEDEEGNIVFQTIIEEVIANAKDGEYKPSQTAGGVYNGSGMWYVIGKKEGDTFAVGDPCCDSLGNSLGVVVQDAYNNYYPSLGDPHLATSYNTCNRGQITVPGVTIEQAIKNLEDATLDVNEYYGDTLAVDVINRLTADVETEGSLLERIKATAAAADYTEDETIGEALARIDGDVETDGSILKKIFDTAADGFYAEEKAYTLDTSAETWLDVTHGTLTKEEYDSLKDGKTIKVGTFNDSGDEYDVVVGYDEENGYYIMSEDDHTKRPATFTEGTKDVTIREAIQNVSKAAEINVVRLENPTESYAASYMITQNGEQVGELIDIPKDFLVKSAKLVHYVQDEEGNIYEIVSDPEMTTPVEKPAQCDLNKDYMDFTINTKDELPAEESHLYIDVTHLCEVYTGKEVEDGISVKISAANEISAEVSGKAIDRENITDEFEADLKAIEDAIGYVDPEAELKELFNVAERINKEAKDGIYKESQLARAYWRENVFTIYVVSDGSPLQAGMEYYFDDGSKGVLCEIPGQDEWLGLSQEAIGDSYTWILKDSYNEFIDPIEVGEKVTIAEAIKALEDKSEDTNGALVLKGEVASKTDLPADAKKGDAYQVADEKALYIKTDDAWVRIANQGEFKVGNEDKAHTVDVKAYIDSRIFVGTQEEVDAAKEAGTIDDTTFVVVTDEEADQFVAISQEEIDLLFDTTVDPQP